MKKSFLIPAIVLYVVRVAFSNNVQVGTVLFTTTDLVRRCWSDYDKSLLRARAIMQDVLPDPDCLDFSNPEAIVILLDYFHTCYKIISISTYGKVQHLLFMALSDAFGGYLRAHVLPYTRKSYYAGTVKYSEAQKLFLLYDDIKSFLKTDGRGWPVPSKAPLRCLKVKPLVITKGTEEACNLLFVFERDDKKHHMKRKGKKSSTSEPRKRVQRQINTYNGTHLTNQNYVKNLSPHVDINENEEVSGFGRHKKIRKPLPLNRKGGIFLGGPCREEVHKEELRREQLLKQELIKQELLKEEERREQARKEEACREEARKQEDLTEEPATDDPSGEDLCKTETHKEDDHNENFNIEDLFKDEDPTEETHKKEEQKEDPSMEEVAKKTDRKEEPCKEDFGRKQTTKEDFERKETTKEETPKQGSSRQHHLKEYPSKGYPQEEKEAKNQQSSKEVTLKVSSTTKKPCKQFEPTLKVYPPKEFSSTESPGKEYILKEVPCKEFILQQDPHRETSTTETHCKEYLLQQDSQKQSSSTEIHYTEYILQEDSRKENFSTTKPSKEYKFQNDTRKEPSTTETHYKEYILQEVSPKENCSTIQPSQEYKLQNETPKEHSSTETHYKEIVFQEDPTTGYPAKTETPSTENPCKESTFEKVFSECEPNKEVHKEETQTEAAPKEEYETEEAPEEETGEEDVLRKETVEEIPAREEVCKEGHKKKHKGRKRKHRKHKCHKKKHSKQGVPKDEGQVSGSKKTVMVPLPVLDDYKCPTSIALPFRKRPLRNLKEASSAFILENYYTTVIKCFIAKGNRRRDIKDFNGQFQRWLTSKVVPLLGDEQWYPGFGGVLRILETIKVLGADKSYKAEECEDYGFLFDEGAEFSVDSSFECKEADQHGEVAKGTDFLRRYMLAIISAVSMVVLFLLCGCLCYCQSFGRRTTSSEEHHDYQESQKGVDPYYADINPSAGGRSNKGEYQDGKKDTYAPQGAPTYDNPKTQGGEVWAFGDTRGIKHRQQQQEAHFLTKHSRFPTQPRLLHNVHTLWKKPSNLMNRYWTSDETKCHKTEMRTMTCNCTESCHCTIMTDSSAVTKAKTRKSSTVTFFEADDDVAHPRRITSTRSSTQYSTTETGSEGFSSSEYSESSKSLRKHRNSTHYP